jgi:hypothetical protein
MVTTAAQECNHIIYTDKKSSLSVGSGKHAGEFYRDDEVDGERT